MAGAKTTYSCGGKDFVENGRCADVRRRPVRLLIKKDSGKRDNVGEVR